MIGTVIAAFISFFSTNIDDIFILMLFFSQVSKDMQIKHVIAGQYLGIITLTIISIVSTFGISIIPKDYVGLLGLVPIYLGIKEYINYKRESNVNDKNLEIFEDNVESERSSQQEKPSLFIKKLINPSILKVAGVTFANGGDNIGIYIPLFSNMNLYSILVAAMVFLLLTALWCFIGLKLTEQPLINNNIKKYKHIFVPIIFIALGIFILIESGTLGLITL